MYKFLAFFVVLVVALWFWMAPAPANELCAPSELHYTEVLKESSVPQTLYEGADLDAFSAETAGYTGSKPEEIKYITFSIPDVDLDGAIVTIQTYGANGCSLERVTWHWWLVKIGMAGVEKVKGQEI
jgi:hypothetical protein